MKANQLWTLWQALLQPFRFCFTRPGFARFVEWLTGLALNVEEHTLTQSLIALERPHDWKALGKPSPSTAPGTAWPSPAPPHA